MPLRLESVMREAASAGALAHILQNEMQAMGDSWGNPSTRHYLRSRDLFDARTGAKIGEYVFTFFINEAERAIEMLDADIVLASEDAVELDFLERYPDSSDANEYYEVQTVDTEQHLNIETVNRHLILSELTGTKHAVYCSAFPFELTVFADEAAFNQHYGFSLEGVKVGDTDYTVGGLSTRFVSPSSLFTIGKDTDDTPWAFVVGTVESLEEATLAFGAEQCDVIIARLDTALGTLPALIGKNVFEVEDVRAGAIVAMHACVKANFKTGPYPKAEPQPTGAAPAEEAPKRRGWFRKKDRQ